MSTLDTDFFEEQIKIIKKNIKDNKSDESDIVKLSILLSTLGVIRDEGEKLL